MFEVRNEGFFGVGGWFCSVLSFLFSFVLPSPAPVVLSEPFEEDLLLWNMESSLKADYI